MMGMMADCAKQKRVVWGHGMKGKQHKTKLEALEIPIVLIDI
jgi:hypothetical protein